MWRVWEDPVDNVSEEEGEGVVECLMFGPEFNMKEFNLSV
jgi:hypothetical protein